MRLIIVPLAVVAAVATLATHAGAAGVTTVGAGYLSGDGVTQARTSFTVPTSCTGSGTSQLGLSGSDGLRLHDSLLAEVVVHCHAGVVTATAVTHDPETGATDNVPLPAGTPVTAYLFPQPNVTVAQLVYPIGNDELGEAITTGPPLKHPPLRVLAGSIAGRDRAPDIGEVSFTGTTFDDAALSPATGTAVQQVRRGVVVATVSRVRAHDSTFLVQSVNPAS